jgi:hypothetical protein
MVGVLDLEAKRHKFSSTLSGGLKYSQKLSKLNKYIHNNNLNKKISGGA